MKKDFFSTLGSATMLPPMQHMRFQIASIPRIRAACRFEFLPRRKSTGLCLSFCISGGETPASFDILVNVLSLVKRVAPEAFMPPGSYNSQSDTLCVSLSFSPTPSPSLSPYLLLSLSHTRLSLSGYATVFWVGGCSRRARIAGCRAVWRTRLEITCKLRLKQRAFQNSQSKV